MGDFKRSGYEWTESFTGRRANGNDNQERPRVTRPEGNSRAKVLARKGDHSAK
jgi:hypothetical protein